MELTQGSETSANYNLTPGNTQKNIYNIQITAKVWNLEILIVFRSLRPKPPGAILRSECGSTRWRTGGEVKGKLANGVGSQYSHTTSERCVSSITNADAHTSAASSRLNWIPRRFKWTRPFRRKTKCGFCACTIRFRTSSTLTTKYDSHSTVNQTSRPTHMYVTHQT